MTQDVFDFPKVAILDVLMKFLLWANSKLYKYKEILCVLHKTT